MNTFLFPSDEDWLEALRRNSHSMAEPWAYVARLTEVDEDGLCYEVYVAGSAHVGCSLWKFRTPVGRWYTGDRVERDRLWSAVGEQIAELATALAVLGLTVVTAVHRKEI